MLMHAGYDIIGDVHGCAFTLHNLLKKMDYVCQDSVWQHPTRTAIFVGDLIDRGPHIREVLSTVQKMVRANTAKMVLGNHELNLLAWSTRRENSADYVLQHEDRPYRMLQQSLSQLGTDQGELEFYLSWMRELPLTLDMGTFRVAHAAWDHSLVKDLLTSYPQGCINDQFVRNCLQAGSVEQNSVEILLNGIRLAYPNDEYTVTPEGFKRNTFRCRFWQSDKAPLTYADAALQPEKLSPNIGETALSLVDLEKLNRYQSHEPLLFVGHYWLDGQPQALSPNVVCVDYSAVIGHKLVAYRWQGESKANNDHFLWESTHPKEKCLNIAPIRI